MDPLKVSKENIWEYRQNKPSRIVRQLSDMGLPPEQAARVLMANGVYKWLAARRDFIRLKNAWQYELTRLYELSAQTRKGSAEHRELVGRIKTLEECRAAIRAICHSDRWRAPDHDERALDLVE